MTTIGTQVTLNGPFVLDRGTISLMVARNPGVYVLTRDGKRANYVGRSDGDVQGRLAQHIGSGYSHFWFAYASSPMDAFLKECWLWHQYSPTDNSIHPDRPNGSGWRCPVCGN